VVLRGPRVLDRSAALRLRSYEVTGIELRFGLERDRLAREELDGDISSEAIISRSQ
jgi:hypothetical protein